MFGGKPLRKLGQGHVTISLNPRDHDIAIR
jgi:hypothetical protein